MQGAVGRGAGEGRTIPNLHLASFYGERTFYQDGMWDTSLFLEQTIRVRMLFFTSRRAARTIPPSCFWVGVCSRLLFFTSWRTARTIPPSCFWMGVCSRLLFFTAWRTARTIPPPCLWGAVRTRLKRHDGRDSHEGLETPEAMRAMKGGKAMRATRGRKATTAMGVMKAVRATDGNDYEASWNYESPNPAADRHRCICHKNCCPPFAPRKTYV